MKRNKLNQKEKDLKNFIRSMVFTRVTNISFIILTLLRFCENGNEMLHLYVIL